jgi:nicotinate-nucleotide adenylyltransferase
MTIESRYGIFGGTFDPIHKGHLKTVDDVARKAKLERVTFVPAARPPHRGNPGAGAHHRLEMVSLAIADRLGFSVDDCELRRDTPSYTYDTVKYLQHDNPDKCFFLIVGLDAFLGIESWYKWRELLQSVHFIVMRRPGWETPAKLPDWWRLGQSGNATEPGEYQKGKIDIIDIEPVPISATEIRFGIANGIDVGELVPIPVWDYICRNNLYLETNETEL